MSDNNKTQEFLQKIAPCIERGELEKCVEKAARVAGEMGIGAEEMLDLSVKEIRGRRHDFGYVLALTASHNLESDKKVLAYSNAGVAARSIGKLEASEKIYKKAIETDPKDAVSHSNYANLFIMRGKVKEAEEHYKKAIELNQNLAVAHYNYAKLLRQQGRQKEAEEHYKKALEINPKDAALQLCEFA